MKILFSANNRTSLEGMVLLIDMLKNKSSKIEPVLACQKSYYETDTYRVLNLDGEKYKSAKLGRQKNIQNRVIESTDIKKRIKHLLCDIKAVIDISGFALKGKRVIDDVRPDCLVISDDRVEGIQLGIIKYARKKHIPVFMISVAEQSDYKHNFRAVESAIQWGREIDKTEIQTITARYGDSQILSVDNVSILFYASGHMKALKFFGMLPEHPWVAGASFPSVVFAYSAYEGELIKEENPEIKVSVTGMIEDEYIFSCKADSSSVKASILQKYDLKKNDEVIVLSMPQLPEHNLVGWDIHKQNMKILVDAVVSQYGYCLISLHPKSRREDYIYLEEDRVRILDERLRDIIKGTDIYLGLDTSSTLHYAKLLQIPGYDLNTDRLCSPLKNGSGLDEMGVLRKVEKYDFGSCNTTDELLRAIKRHMEKRQIRKVNVGR